MLSLTRRSRLRDAIGPASAALALTLGHGAASAQADRGISLRWTAPPGCPAAATITAEKDRLLGDRPARPAAPIDVSASVSREDGGGFRVHIETRSEGETRVREVHGASCAAIADATALILAMMIDPSLAAAAPERAPSPPPKSDPGPAAPAPAAPPAPPAPSTTPPVAPARASAPRSRPIPSPSRAANKARTPPARVSFGLLGWAGADVGSLPGVGFGFGAAGVVHDGAQHFELGVGAWLEQSATLPERPSAGGDISLFAAATGTCRELYTGPIAIAPCLALELGAMHAKGFGVTSPDQTDAFWAALKGGGALSFTPVSRVDLVLRLEAVVPLVAPTFVLDGVGQVHQPSVGGRAALGVELGF